MSAAAATPAPRIVQRPLRLPSVGECAELLAAGQRPGSRVGWWVDAAGDDRERWWPWALDLARRDTARRAA